MSIFLGKGSYGSVTIRDGYAVKKFSKLAHLIQEYLALKYLSDCKHIVHVHHVDFENLEIYMDLYDGSLKKFLEENMLESMEDKMKVIKGILLGLVEMHDRGLVHGDLKPGNILVRKDPLKAVLGDCGFVSVGKYAKVERTAKIYRDPTIAHDYTHDMYSFGICFLEMIGEIRLNKQATYEEINTLVDKKIEEEDYRNVLYRLLNKEKSERPTSRETLKMLFGEDSGEYENTSLSWRYLSEISKPNITMKKEKRMAIRELMKYTAHKFKIRRSYKGYGALIYHLDSNNICDKYDLYVGVTLMILSSIFGTSWFGIRSVGFLCDNITKVEDIHYVLEKLLNDMVFIIILLYPSRTPTSRNQNTSN